MQDVCEYGSGDWEVRGEGRRFGRVVAHVTPTLQPMTLKGSCGRVMKSSSELVKDYKMILPLE